MGMCSQARLVVVACLAALAQGLQLQALRQGPSALQLPVAATRASTRCQFGGGEQERSSITRDSEPEEFFATNMDNMSDAEKLKSPAVIIGLGILVVPFVVGMIALSLAQ